jgi:hypothetical protein
MIPKSGHRFSEKLMLNRRSGAGGLFEKTPSRSLLDWRIGFAVTTVLCVLLPFLLPQYSLTVLIEALIFGLLAMSLDLLVG